MIDYLALALAQEDEEERETEKGRLCEEIKRAVIPAGKFLSGTVRLTGRAGNVSEKGPAEESDESRLPLASEDKAEKKPAKAAVRKSDSAAADVVRQLAEKEAYAVPGERRSRGAAGESAAAALLSGLRRAEAGAGLTHGQGRPISVVLPGAEESSPGWGPEELDRAVERDARRYDGGFSLY